MKAFFIQIFFFSLNHEINSNGMQISQKNNPSMFGEKIEKKSQCKFSIYFEIYYFYPIFVCTYIICHLGFFSALRGKSKIIQKLLRDSDLIKTYKVEIAF